jgi:hypothetical protein
MYEHKCVKISKCVHICIHIHTYMHVFKNNVSTNICAYIHIKRIQILAALNMSMCIIYAYEYMMFICINEYK